MQKIIPKRYFLHINKKYNEQQIEQRFVNAMSSCEVKRSTQYELFLVFPSLSNKILIN